MGRGHPARVPAFLPPIVTRQQLARQGYTRVRIDHELTLGNLLRIRTGYFARPDAPADLVAAVRAGGIATGVTALRHHGVWVPPDRRLHVAVASHAHPRPAEGVVFHWVSPFLPTPPTGLRFTPVMSVAAALDHALRGLAPELAVAICDSALHERRIGSRLLGAVLEGLPRRLTRRIRHAIDGRSESGMESVARFLLIEEGLQVQLQVTIDGVGRVDLLIDGWLIIELDGAHHADPVSMRRDRARDAAAILRGYRTLRFGYDAVMYDWPSVLATIVAVLADGAPRAAAR